MAEILREHSDSLVNILNKEVKKFNIYIDKLSFIPNNKDVLMKESGLYKAIYNLGSVKALVKKLGIQPEHIYARIKGVSKLPLEYALQIDYLTDGEIHWKDLVPFYIVQRLRTLILVLKKLNLPPCELVYVSIERIHCVSHDGCFTQFQSESENDLLVLNKRRPICIDSSDIFIIGNKTLNFYKQHHKRTLSAEESVKKEEDGSELMQHAA